MAGRNYLFIPGPTNIPDRIRQACAVWTEDQRAYNIPEFTLPLFADLKKIFKTKTGQVFLFPASGTGGWEAAITNTLSPGDKVLCSRFGQFSHLWADMCRRLGLDVEIIDVEWGQGVPVEQYAERLAADKDHQIKAVLACHNETATGVTSDIAGVRKALDDANHPALLYVDGVSSIASIDFRMDEWGVDLAVSGSQKGFMMPTGLAIVGVSQKALETRKSAQLRRCFFDFDDMINTNKDGFFPYTPAMTLIRGLRESVNVLLEEGLDNVFARHYRMAEGVRRAVHAWGLNLCAQEPKWYSDTVSAIVVPEHINSSDVVTTAAKRYNVAFGGGLNKVAGKVFRIGHLGDTNEALMLLGLATAEMTLRDVGVEIELGSGVAATQEYYQSTGQSAETPVKLVANQ